MFLFSKIFEMFDEPLRAELPTYLSGKEKRRERRAKQRKK